MQSRWLITAMCGLAAAICNLAPLTGNAMGFMLSMVAPMPIFAAGLMQGWPHALFAGLLAIGANLLVGGDQQAMLFGATVAVPAILLVRQALLAQQDQDGNLIWYPVNRLAYLMALLGTGMGIVTIIVLGQGAFDAVAGAMIDMVDTEGQIDASGRAQLVEGLNRVAPAVIAASLVVTLVINAAFAQRIAERLQRAVRPALLLTSLRLPVFMTGLLAALVLVSSFLDGLPGQVALIGATMVGLLFTLQGLAVIHLFARARPNGVLMLAFTYLIVLFTMPVLGPIPLLFIMLLGIADTFLNVRPSPPAAGT